MKLSQWHDSKVKPVHVGIYQRGLNGFVYYYYWNGKFWEYGGAVSPERIYRNNKETNNLEYKWRGIVK